MKQHSSFNKNGFTLIELMVVMSIVALLLTTVGPLAMNSLDRAEAKQELLTVRNWLKKISARSYHTGTKHTLVVKGKNASLFRFGENEALEEKKFTVINFEPQNVIFSQFGFVDTNTLVGTYREQKLTLELSTLVNGFKLENLPN